MRREVVKRRVGPALHLVMEPGDQIMVGTSAIMGPSAAWDLLPGLPAVAGEYDTLAEAMAESKRAQDRRLGGGHTGNS